MLLALKVMHLEAEVMLLHAEALPLQVEVMGWLVCYEMEAEGLVLV